MFGIETLKRDVSIRNIGFLSCFVVAASIYFISVTTLSLLSAFYIGVMVIVSSVLIVWPAVSLYAILILCPYYFISHSLLSSGIFGITTKFNPIDYFTVISLLGIIYHYLFRSSRSITLNNVDIAVVLWLLISMASFLHGYGRGYEAVFRSSRGPLLYVLYFVAMHGICSINRLKQLSVVILFSSVMMGFVGIMGSFGVLTPFFPTLSVGIVADLFARPNFFVDPALSIAFIVFISSVYLFYGKTSLWVFFLMVLGFILNVTVLMLSVTRGFWIGLGFSILSMFFISSLKKYLKSIIAVYYALAVILVVLLVQAFGYMWADVNLLEASLDRFVSAVSSGSTQSVSWRLEEFNAYYSSFKDSPIWGQGFGSPVVFDEASNVGFAHNQYIWILETSGVIGMIAFCGLLYIFVTEIFKCNLNDDKVDFHKCYQVLSVSVLFGYAITSVSSPEFTNPTIVPFLATIIGMNKLFQKNS
jgi:O-antigen ligase